MKKEKKQKRTPKKYDTFVMQFGFEYPDRTAPKRKNKK